MDINNEMLEALKSLACMHRNFFGLDGAWDKELLKAEEIIKRAEKMSDEQ